MLTTRFLSRVIPEIIIIQVKCEFPLKTQGILILCIHGDVIMPYQGFELYIMEATKGFKIKLIQIPIKIIIHAS